MEVVTLARMEGVMVVGWGEEWCLLVQMVRYD